MSQAIEMGRIRKDYPLADDSMFLRKPVSDADPGEAAGGGSVVAGLILKTLLVFLSVVGIYFLLRSGENLAFFDVRTIEVRGAVHLGPDRVREIVRKEFPANLNALDLDKVRRRLEKISWVRTAQVRKAYPDALEVDVTERKPVGVACLGKLWLFDREGVLLEEFRPEAGWKDQPLLTGLLPAKDGVMPEENRERIALFLRFLDAVEAEDVTLARRISEIDVSDREDIVLVPMEGIPRVHLGDGNHARRVRRFFQMLPRIRSENAPVAEVDMRSDGMMVLKTAGGR